MDMDLGGIVEMNLCEIFQRLLASMTPWVRWQSQYAKSEKMDTSLLRDWSKRGRQVVSVATNTAELLYRRLLCQVLASVALEPSKRQSLGLFSSPSATAAWPCDVA